MNFDNQQSNGYPMAPSSNPVGNSPSSPNNPADMTGKTTLESPLEDNKKKLLANDEETKSLTTGNEEDGGLAKSLTLMNGVSIIVGCIIGSGIFLTPSTVQQLTGSVGMTLCIWTACGVFVGIGSYCYAELGTLIKRSGGDYAYIMEAYGPALAFIRLFIEAIIIRPSTITVVALVFAAYIIRPFYGDCDPPKGTKELIAAALITLLTAINCISVKWATKVQDFFTVAKMLAVFLIIGTGLFLFFRGDPVNRASFDNIFEGTTSDILQLSLAFYSGLFTYQGWNYLNFIVEELQNPKRNLPLAILISCVSVTIFYVVINASLYTVLSPAEMGSGSQTIALDFSNRVFGKAGVIAMCFFVACSTLGSANGVIFTSSRLFYVGAREGQMPELLIMINKVTRTPIPAVTLTGFLSLLYLLVGDDAGKLINCMQVSYWLAIGLTVSTIFYFRRKIPDAPRPIKVNLILPAFFVLGCAALVILPIFQFFKDNKLEELGIGVGAILSSFVVYVIFIGWKSKPRFVADLTDRITVFFQKLFLVINDDKKET